jgi:hypothetical protein
VPPDLVERALRFARMNYKFFPKPSELLDPIREELGSRRRHLRSIEIEVLGRSSMRPEPHDMATPERWAELRKMVSNGVKRIETDSSD